LVNNAGVSTASARHIDRIPAPTEETPDDLRFVYETNVFGVVRVTNAFVPLLRRAPAGRIVNVTSKRGPIGEEGAWVGQPDMAYSSSKTALNALTAHYARGAGRHAGQGQRRRSRSRSHRLQRLLSPELGLGGKKAAGTPRRSGGLGQPGAHGPVQRRVRPVVEHRAQR
jgi:hypothetical protein